jgi:hypothetical protein
MEKIFRTSIDKRWQKNEPDLTEWFHALGISLKETEPSYR